MVFFFCRSCSFVRERNEHMYSLNLGHQLSQQLQYPISSRCSLQYAYLFVLCIAGKFFSCDIASSLEGGRNQATCTMWGVGCRLSCTTLNDCVPVAWAKENVYQPLFTFWFSIIEWCNAIA